jgi:hypothetical protein
LEVANCYLAESENMYFDINLNPTFVSDDNFYFLKMDEIYSGRNLKCREQVPPKRSYFPVSLKCHKRGYQI